jgi:hypothetical protein
VFGVLNLHNARKKVSGNSPAGSKVEVGITPVRPHGGLVSQVFVLNWLRKDGSSKMSKWCGICFPL